MSKRFYAVTKRFVDLSLAGVAIVAASPAMVVIAAAIKIRDGGSPLFRQPRAGQHGEEFQILKFRTMTEVAAQEERVYDWSDGVPDDFVFKSAGDSSARVTPLGKWLRRLSLDELPQLINVCRGEMSLVGPRPELVEIARCYSPEQRRRLDVKPGITGWAQVNGRSGIDHGQKIRADLYYVDNASMLVDFKVILRTITVALTGREAH